MSEGVAAEVQETTSEFEQWLGRRHPWATVWAHHHDELQRMLIGFYDRPISIQEALFVIREAGMFAGWLPWNVDWTRQADGRLTVRTIRLVRGTV